GGTEYEIVTPMGIPAAVKLYVEAVGKPIGVRLLPFASPHRSAGRHQPLGDRPAARHVGINVPAAKEPEAAMVEIVLVKFVDAGLRGSCGKEWVEPAVLEMDVHARHGLMTKVLADDAGAGLRVVGLPDARHQQVLGV